ncbi:hypothetical protein PF008_g25129 [Phytophthora fragariae]|uniref:Uncharacterized protein n=2 Tax=Phytophthora fragariae TaxID=53985 RepID=A0A6G0QLN3_9STRA|nr:hypothetical protein PF008_g25129 [Phytophthora fragariae]
MNTENFDDGSFWLFVDPPPATLYLAVTGLSLVGIGYIVVLLMMVLRPKRVMHFPPSALQTWVENTSRTNSSALKLLNSFTQPDSTSRRFVKLGMKIGDLVFETILLVQILEAGSPAAIVGIFTVIIASNALVWAVMMLLPLNRMALVETLVGLLFDLLIAVGCPMLILVYCLSNFNFPRDKFAINIEAFPAGWFERKASIVANPVQTAVIYNSLRSLRITSVYEFFARMGVHVTLFLSRAEKTKDPQSMRTSTLACAPHPECAVKAHRWTLMENGSLNQCPCLIMIDRDIAPKTYAEWEMPKNLTEKVIQLASSGDLQTLQLTNRSCLSFRKNFATAKE